MLWALRAGGCQPLWRAGQAGQDTEGPLHLLSFLSSGQVCSKETLGKKRKSWGQEGRPSLVYTKAAAAAKVPGSKTGFEAGRGAMVPALTESSPRRAKMRRETAQTRQHPVLAGHPPEGSAHTSPVRVRQGPDTRSPAVVVRRLWGSFSLFFLLKN